MTHRDQIAQRLDGLDIDDLPDQRDTMELAREAGVAIVYVTTNGVVLSGAFEEACSHFFNRPLLLTRQGRMEVPTYGGKGVTAEHRQRIFEQGLAVPVQIEGKATRAPFWELSAPVPFSSFTLRRNGREYCQAIALACSDLPDVDRTGGFQKRTAAWVTGTFGQSHQDDMRERCDRVIEEVLELMQSLDYPAEAVESALRYVYGRGKGEAQQEVGGVMVTMAALCDAAKIDMYASGEIELNRVETVPHLVRAKQERKPRFERPAKLSLVQGG